MDKKQQIMELWRRSFHDSEEFIQFYFDRKYSDENSLVYEENGKALSALLMLPYPMTWLNTTLATSYISGACTLQDARNHGYMTLLLQGAFSEMNKRGIALSTLIPAEEWLFKYYRNLGYVPVFDYSTEHFHPSSSPTPEGIEVYSPQTYDRDFTMKYYDYFRQQMQKRPCCIQHPEEDYKTIVEEAYHSGGRLITTHTKKEITPSGWALVLPENHTLKIKELFYHSIHEKTAILTALSNIWQPSDIICQIPPTGENQQRYGMARITNAFLLLQHLASNKPEISLSLQINDPQLAANDGIYILSGGNCEKKEKGNIEVDLETDIPNLTEALLGYHTNQLPQILNSLTENQQPYMNLMLD